MFWKNICIDDRVHILVFSCCVGKPAAIQYGTGAISGFFSEDHVTVGDLVVQDQVYLRSLSYILNFFLNLPKPIHVVFSGIY